MSKGFLPITMTTSVRSVVSVAIALFVASRDHACNMSGSRPRDLNLQYCFILGSLSQIRVVCLLGHSLHGYIVPD